MCRAEIKTAHFKLTSLLTGIVLPLKKKRLHWYDSECAKYVQNSLKLKKTIAGNCTPTLLLGDAIYPLPRAALTTSIKPIFKFHRLENKS